MPILNDIMDNKLYGPKIRAAEARGQAEGERAVIARLIGRRFGSVPNWVHQRLATLSGPELEKIELRLLDAPNLDELFQ